LESRHKGSNALSIKSPVVDKERMTPDQLANVSASFPSVLCYDADGWVVEKTSGVQKPCSTNTQRFSSETDWRGTGWPRFTWKYVR